MAELRAEFRTLEAKIDALPPKLMIAYVLNSLLISGLVFVALYPSGG